MLQPAAPPMWVPTQLIDLNTGADHCVDDGGRVRLRILCDPSF